MTCSPSISPSDLGLPAKFTSWRPDQWECVQTATETPKRFIACSIPTGGGKSLFGIASTILDGSRSIYLTSTKGLQKQLLDDFSSIGLTDMRGRQNYQCRMSSSRLSCSEGRILGCRDSSCSYNLSRDEFLSSRLCSTNYAYYLSSIIHSEGVGETGLIILDECHNAIQELSSVIEIKLPHSQLNHIYTALSTAPPYSEPLSSWRTWAKFLLPKAQTYLQQVKKSGNHRWLNLTDAFVLSLGRLGEVSESWILDESNSHEMVISPLWPTDYAEPYLFHGVPRVILLSATLVPKTLTLLGIPESESIFLSQDHTFPAHRSPVYLFGAARIDHKTSDGDWLSTIGIMDTFIGKRLDRKGIIHPVSYDRQERILKHSKYADLMIAPKKSSEFQDSVEEFRKSPAPRILITPAATTGYDFPFSQCEYNIIVKVPFIYGRSPIMKARAEKDPEYLPYLTAQTLVQTCGRAMRAPTDQCENLILDNHASWFLRPQEKGGYRHLIPPWFMRQVVYQKSQPDPLPKLPE